jgi:S-layer protein (TIGR01567 family)
MDGDDEITITPDTPLKLAEGYKLNITAIDNTGMFLELTKNGEVVDSALRLPSKTGATMGDKTYYYKKDMGNQKDLVIIAVHFKDAVTIGSKTAAVVDGIWQISETATEVKVDTEYGKMRIATVTADTITMDNKDNTITLSKNKDMP